MRLCGVNGCANRHNSNGFCMTHQKRVRLHGDVNHTRQQSIPKKCSINSCFATVDARGWCQKHYVRWKVHGDPTITKLSRLTEIQERVCSVPGCTRILSKKSMCDMHYQRLLKTGTTAEPFRVLHPKRYRQIKLLGHQMSNQNSGRVYVHRVVLFDSIGYAQVPCFWCGTRVRFSRSGKITDEEYLVVDHRDHDRHNNVLQNLIPSCNHCNCVRNRKNKTALVSIYSSSDT